MNYRDYESGIAGITKGNLPIFVKLDFAGLIGREEEMDMLSLKQIIEGCI